MERAIEFRIEHLNELGDLCFKTLVVEIMGKHSNIIFLNEERMILDSIKHVSCNVSSVREVLPQQETTSYQKHKTNRIHLLCLNKNFLTRFIPNLFLWQKEFIVRLLESALVLQRKSVFGLPLTAVPPASP